MYFNATIGNFDNVLYSLIDLNSYTYLIVLLTAVSILFTIDTNLLKLKNSHKNIKGPIGLPIVGNLLQLSNVSTHLQLTEFSHIYGNIYKLKLGTYKTIVINGVESVHQALVKQSDDFSCRPSFASFKQYAEGRSISFQRHGDLFKKHRRTAIYALGRAQSSGTAQDAVNRGSETLRRRLYASSGHQVDAASLVTASIGSILYRICFGADIRDDPEYELFVSASNPSTQLFAAGRQPDLLPGWLRWLWRVSERRSNDRRMQILCALNERMVREWNGGEGRDPNCILSQMMAAANKLPEQSGQDDLTKDHLLSTTIELISAGTDTSSTTITWLLAFMAAYPEVQRRLRRHLVDDGIDTPYLEAVVLEVTRLSTIVPFALPHRCRRRTSLCGHLIEEDTVVLANLWSVGRDKLFWGSDVDDFRPERFLKFNESSHAQLDTRLSSRLMLFGAGRRRCIGETLGKLQVHTLFRDIVIEFRIHGEDVDLTPIFGDVLKPKPFKVAFLPLTSDDLQDI